MMHYCCLTLYASSFSIARNERIPMLQAPLKSKTKGFVNCEKRLIEENQKLDARMQWKGTDHRTVHAKSHGGNVAQSILDRYFHHATNQNSCYSFICFIRR